MHKETPDGPFLPIVKKILEGIKTYFKKAIDKVFTLKPVVAKSAGSIAEKILDKTAIFWSKVRKISFDKALLIWALVIIAGVFLFRLNNRNMPEMNSNLVFATWWEDTLNDQTLTKLINEFEAQNHGITVQLKKMDWDDIWELLETGEKTPAGAAGNIPDIFSIDPYAIHELKNRSYLAVFENDEVLPDNVLPVVSFINPLFYNIDLLETAGFYRPPKNQTEFLSYVQRLKEIGVNGAGIALSNPRNISQQFLSWIWAAAGSFGPDESFSFNSREVIATLNFLNQLYQNLYTDPFYLSDEELLDAFSKGQLGMMVSSVEDIKKLKTMRINFGITTIPGPESYAKKPVFSLAGWYVGINRRSVNQEGAQKFATFLKENAENIAIAAYAIPGNGKRSRELSRDDPFYAKAFDMYEASEMVRELYFSDISGLNNIIRREIELMFRGSKTAEQCAEAIQQDREKLAGIAHAVW